MGDIYHLNYENLSIDAEARDSWRDRMIPPTSFDDAVEMQEDNILAGVKNQPVKKRKQDIYNKI